MPTLNEAENLKWLLPHLVGVYQVLVVDNGSTDDSHTTALQLGAQVIPCPEKGYGIAVLTGLKFLKGLALPYDPVVVVFDADGTSPVNRIEDTTKPLLSGEADLVIAQRTTLQVGAMPPHARFGNWLTVTLIKLFTGQTYRDMGPMRSFRLSTIESLDMADKTWGWNVEMQMKAAYQGLRIKEIHVTYLARKFGKSKISGSVMGSIKAGSRIIYRTFYYFVEEKCKNYPAIAALRGK